MKVTVPAPALNVQEYELLPNGVPDIVQPVSETTKPLSVTEIRVPGRALVGDGVAVGAALTFTIAISVETNNAIRTTSNVAASLMRRRALKSKHTSLRMIE